MVLGHADAPMYMLCAKLSNNAVTKNIYHVTDRGMVAACQSGQHVLYEGASRLGHVKVTTETERGNATYQG